MEDQNIRIRCINKDGRQRKLALNYVLNTEIMSQQGWSVDDPEYNKEGNKINTPPAFIPAATATVTESKERSDVPFKAKGKPAFKPKKK